MSTTIFLHDPATLRISFPYSPASVDAIKQIVGTRCIVRGGEVYIVGMKIDPYQVGNTALGYDPLQTRKLLLRKKQILELEKNGDLKGNTIIPLVVYGEKNLIKVKIALCRGKKIHDKRESLKKRDTDRTLAREYKTR
jgi:SsrA-binding protein